MISLGMRKLKRLLKRLLLFSLFIILAIVLFNTFTNNTHQIDVPAYSAPNIPQGVETKLQAAIQIPTISTVENLDSSAFTKFNDLLQTQFPLVDSILEHEIISDFSHIYHWRGKDESLAPILLLAHLDVVPIEASTKADWKVEPFSGKIENDFIWGRGSLDDKLNVIGILEAAEVMLEKQYIPMRSVYFAFGHDEEIGGKNGAQKMAQHFKNKGIEFAYVMDEGMIVLENAMPGVNNPVGLIGVSEKGYASITITADLGEGGHSSMPPPETAIGVLSKAIATLQDNPFPASLEGVPSQTFDFTSPEMSFGYKMIFSNQWLFKGLLKKILSGKKTTNALIRTTTAPTIISGGTKDNVLPSKAEATINFRIKPGETSETVIERLNDIIDDDRVTPSMKKFNFSSEPSPISPVDGFGFTTIQKTIQELFPESIVAPAMVIAGTDARFYSDVSKNIYRFMPVQLTNEDLPSIHGINEKIHVDAYRKLVQFYMRLIENSSR